MMKDGFKSFLRRWLINTLAVLVTTYILRDRIHYGSPVDLLAATLILGILNAFVRPLLMLLSLPLLIFTLGLFTLVINAVLLLTVSALMGPKQFHVDGFWSAFWGALVISIVSIVLNSLTGSRGAKTEVKRGKVPPQNRDDDSPGGGPVIDV